MPRYQTRQTGARSMGGALGARVAGINRIGRSSPATYHRPGEWANEIADATQGAQRLSLQQFGMDRQRRLDDETRQNRQWEQDRQERLDRMGALQWGLGFGTEQQKLQAHADMLRKQLGLQDAAESRAKALFDRGEAEWSADAANRDARRQAEGKMWSDYLTGAPALGLVGSGEGAASEGGETGATGGALAGTPGALVPSFAGGKTGLRLSPSRQGKAAKAPRELKMNENLAAAGAKMAERMGFDVSGLWAPDKSNAIPGLEGTPTKMSDQAVRFWQGELERAYVEGGAQSLEEAVWMAANNSQLPRAGAQQQTPAAPPAKPGWWSRMFGGGQKDAGPASQFLPEVWRGFKDAAKQTASAVNQAIPTPKGVKREEALAILSKARERAIAEGPAGAQRLQQIGALNNAVAQGAGQSRPPPGYTGTWDDWVNVLVPDEDVSGAPIQRTQYRSAKQGFAPVEVAPYATGRATDPNFVPKRGKPDYTVKAPVGPDREQALDATTLAGLAGLRDYGSGDAPPSTPPAQLGAQAHYGRQEMPTPEQSGAAAFYRKAGQPGQSPVSDEQPEQALSAVAAGPQSPAATQGGLTLKYRPDGTPFIFGRGSGLRRPAKKAAPAAKPQDWLSSIAADPQSRAKALGIVRYAQAAGLTPDDAKAMLAQVFSGQLGQVR